MNPQPMSHEESLEIAGLYVLDALTPEETAAVVAHLADCPEDHAEIDELGAVTPALATLAEPVGAPASLKLRVLEAYEAANPGARPAQPLQIDVAKSVPVAAARRPVPNWMGWAAAGVALVLLAVLGVVGLNLRQQADRANQRAEQLSAAIAAMSEPGAQVAILHGSGPAAGISGFVAIPAGGTGYMVMTDVPAAPPGMTYQAWYIAGGTPTSAGTMSSSADGKIVASGLQPVPGTSVVAVTVEPSGGSEQPTSAPIIVGNLSTTS